MEMTGNKRMERWQRLTVHWKAIPKKKKKLKAEHVTFKCEKSVGAARCLHIWDTMMSDRCEIIKSLKKSQNQKERHGQTEGLKAVHDREKGRTPVQNKCAQGQHRDHWQVVQKENKDNHHSNREGARSLEESLAAKVATATKLESSEIKFKTVINAVSYIN